MPLWKCWCCFIKLNFVKHKIRKSYETSKFTAIVLRAMEIVMYCLELDSGSVSRGELDLGKIEAEESVPKVFSSDLGTSLLAESLRQQVIFLLRCVTSL